MPEPAHKRHLTSTVKNWKKGVVWENLYELWLIASGARRLRGLSQSARAHTDKHIETTRFFLIIFD